MDGYTHFNQLLYSKLRNMNSSSDNLTTLDGGDDSTTSGREQQIIGVTKYRWVILAVFSLQNFVNSILWICFVPIQSTITEYYHVSSTKANLLSLLFLICALPTAAMAMIVQERYGFHIVVYVGVACQTAGAWIRYAGQGHGSFGVLILGSLVAGPAMACFMATPSVLAALWFPDGQRQVATAIGSLTGVIGMLVAFVLSPAIVGSPDDIPTFLLVQAIVPTVAGLTVFLFRKKPPLPPSASQEVEKMPLLLSIKECFRNKAFLFLLAGFSLGVGVFNAITTVVDQLVNPYGYSSDDSGTLGALLIGVGLVGAVILSAAVEKTHKYKIFILLGIWGCLISFIGMTLSLKPDNLPSLSASWAFMGLFGLPVLPLTLECAVELTFPVPEVVSNGILMVFSQLLGVVFTLVVDAMEDPDTGSIKNGCWLLVALVVLGAVLFSCFKPEYKRLEYEKKNQVASFSAGSSPPNEEGSVWHKYFL